MISEAGHYKLFMDLARTYKDNDYVKERWSQYLNHEVEIFNSIELEVTECIKHDRILYYISCLIINFIL